MTGLTFPGTAVAPAGKGRLVARDRLLTLCTARSREYGPRTLPGVPARTACSTTSWEVESSPCAAATGRSRIAMAALGGGGCPGVRPVRNRDSGGQGEEREPSCCPASCTGLGPGGEGRPGPACGSLPGSARNYEQRRPGSLPRARRLSAPPPPHRVSQP